MRISEVYSLITLVACVSSASSTFSRYAGSRPNIILMFADDIGWGDLGANWNRTVDTPNLDTLAKEGIRLTDFHAGASICTPSRAALMTGRYGLRTGVVKNFGTCSVGGLPLNETTIAEVLRDAGYETFMIGKWHLGVGPDEMYHPINRGFQHYVGVPYSVDMGCKDKPGYDLPMEKPCPKDNGTQSNLGSPALPLYNDSKIVEQPVDIYHLGDTYVGAFERLAGQAIKSKNPFFAYVPFSHMHTPLAFDEKFVNISERGIYGDTLRELDTMVGQIMDTVDKYGQTKNTLLVFTGDNGNWELKCQYSGSPGPFLGLWQKFRGGGGGTAKHTVWEAGHREPSLAYWPGVIQPGSVSSALLSAMDLFPTFVSLAGAKMPPNRMFDGIDQSKVLFEDTSAVGHEALFHHSTITLTFEAVRYKQWKAIYKTGGTGGCHSRAGPLMDHNPPLLFNLDEDPAEEYPLDTNLPEYSSIAKKINMLLAAKFQEIKNDNTTVVNYHSDCHYRPCCNPQHVVCRCQD